MRKKTKNLVFERQEFTSAQINALFNKAIIDTQAIIDNPGGHYPPDVVAEAILELERLKDKQKVYNEKPSG